MQLRMSVFKKTTEAEIQNQQKHARVRQCTNRMSGITQNSETGYTKQIRPEYQIQDKCSASNTVLVFNSIM